MVKYGERWQKIGRIYHAARELDASARAEFLAKACAGDDDLRREVESLMAQDEDVASFLQSPAIEMAAEALAKEKQLSDPAKPALEIGTMVAHYRLTGKIGAGGMGEVYRARDTKLQRDVALKILPQAMAQDAQRMARFEREAQVLASLNHPNIAAIHGLEESNGIHALVMELVEGETLGERISVAPGFSPASASLKAGSTTGERRPLLAIDDALPIAQQIAEALEYAHERGVIHRDLKPANVKITPEGTVKVLDFGLAKVLGGMGVSPVEVHGQARPERSEWDAHATDQDSPTLTTLVTQPGMLLGTAAYMSPEQARGQRVDRRCDIWAFGCVLFEMLTGRKAFEGETLSDVLAAVLTKQPDWTALADRTPSSIQRLIHRCLQKDVRQRLQAIGEARIAIEETLSGTGVPPVGAHGQDAHATRPLRRVLPWAVAGILVCVAAFVGWWFGTRSVASSANWSGEILPGPTIAFFPRVSPNGNLIAFQAMVDNQSQVAVMDPASGNWTVLTHDRTDGWVTSLGWSHDGSRIYFDRQISRPLGVYSVPSLGGEVRLVLANAVSPEPLPDGSLLLSRLDPDRKLQICHYWPDTGRLQALEAWPQGSSSFSWLRVFPGGKEAVFFGTVKRNSPENSPRLYLLDIAAGSTRLLAGDLHTQGIFSLAVTPDGQSVLVDLPLGNLHRIIAVPRSGTGPVRTLVTLTARPNVWDVAPDGSLYIDQVDWPLEILRCSASGGTPELLASSQPFDQYHTAPVEFHDGRLLLPELVAGRPRLLLGKPGENFVPLIETNEETAPPMARIGSNEAAFIEGSPPLQSLAIASVKDGRIIRRFKATEGKNIWALAPSPDGKDLYYVTSGSVWSIPSQGESPRKICAGDSVAVDPNGHDLIVSLVEQENVRLERVPLSGGPAQPIQVESELAIDPEPLGPEALNKDGKLLVAVVARNSYFFRLAILDLATGKLVQVPLNYSGDIVMPAWASDGRILATAAPFRARIWRFRPAK